MTAERGNAKLIPLIAIGAALVWALLSGAADALGVRPLTLALWGGLFAYMFMAGGLGAVVRLIELLFKVGAALLLWPVTLAAGAYWLYVQSLKAPRDPEEVIGDEREQTGREKRERRESRERRQRQKQQAEQESVSARVQSWAVALEWLQLDDWDPSDDQIDTAYKKQAKEYHPDRSDRDDANEIMTQINKAQQVLKEYDAPPRPEGQEVAA